MRQQCSPSHPVATSGKMDECVQLHRPMAHAQAGASYTDIEQVTQRKTLRKKTGSSALRDSELGMLCFLEHEHIFRMHDSKTGTVKANKNCRQLFRPCVRGYRNVQIHQVNSNIMCMRMSPKGAVLSDRLFAAGLLNYQTRQIW